MINVPLSLKYAMRLTGGQAYVGFTASTGAPSSLRAFLDPQHALFQSSAHALCQDLSDAQLSAAD